MRRNTLNFVVDATATLVMLAIIATGLLLWLALPPGSRGGRGLSLWGMGRHDWGDIHFWLALSFVALLILHVILHWTWVCYTVRGWLRPPASQTGKLPQRGQNLYGVGFLAVVVVLVGGFVWLGSASVVRSGDDQDGPGRRRHGRQAAVGRELPYAERDGLAPEAGRGGRGGRGSSDERVRGSTTLREAAELAGLSVERLKQELGLPADVPTDARLGHIRRQYGVQMSTVRQVVERHRTRKPGGPGAGEG